ncbi:hypothetical protein EKPJFOCH_0002 [Methylobacterium thuringiense]|uniref:Uncharacterized protein n=1 Tax=Methylobacterium thuringiense TaxID=1003091 RepID=A0ABQ4TG46_9HYPH|nr:hypothetical protein EKPJFOCH_0002 [Methylobacterium thuringiense]
MNTICRDGWSSRDADRSGDVQSSMSRIFATIRVASTPSNLLLALAVIAGWLALVSWTGVGPDGWQARSCADLDLGRTACNAARLSKNQDRLVPHTMTTGFVR